MQLTFAGKRALLLGGSCELAVTLARAMIETELFPLLTWRSRKGRAYIDEKLQAYEGRYDTLHLDFSQRASLSALSERIAEEIDFSVDFAQGNFETLIASADEEQVYRYFEENISFRAAAIRKIARAMLKRKQGRLLFVSSAAAERPNPGQGFYAAAKLASEALYRNLGLELGNRGITTLCLRPGYIDAGRGRPYLQQHAKDIAAKVPIKRALSAREVAQSLLFFLSESAAGFNAACIPLDGGLTAGK